MAAEECDGDALAQADEPSVVRGPHAEAVGDVCANSPLSEAAGRAGPSGGTRSVEVAQREERSPLSAADVLSAPEWLEVAAWARTHSSQLVGIYLFGSRMRGDHRPESDMDIALVIRDGAYLPVHDLPQSILGIAVDWVPTYCERMRAGLRRMGVPWVLASRGIRLWGQTLSPVDKTLRQGTEMQNVEEAQHNLLESLNSIRGALANALMECDPSPLQDLPESSGLVAARSTYAAEMACKSVLALRGLEPTRSHSAKAHLAVIRRQDPDDPLLPLLERLNGAATPAHTAGYFDSRFKEPFDASIARTAAAADAVVAIVEELQLHPGKSTFSESQEKRLHRVLNQIQEDSNRLCCHEVFNCWLKDRVPKLVDTIHNVLLKEGANGGRVRWGSI